MKKRVFLSVPQGSPNISTKINYKINLSLFNLNKLHSPAYLKEFWLTKAIMKEEIIIFTLLTIWNTAG